MMEEGGAEGGRSKEPVSSAASAPTELGVGYTIASRESDVMKGTDIPADKSCDSVSSSHSTPVSANSNSSSTLTVSIGLPITSIKKSSSPPAAPSHDASVGLQTSTSESPLPVTSCTTSPQMPTEPATEKNTETLISSPGKDFEPGANSSVSSSIGNKRSMYQKADQNESTNSDTDKQEENKNKRMKKEINEQSSLGCTSNVSTQLFDKLSSNASGAMRQSRNQSQASHSSGDKSKVFSTTSANSISFSSVPTTLGVHHTLSQEQTKDVEGGTNNLNSNNPSLSSKLSSTDHSSDAVNNATGPKVPPIKIVLPSMTTSASVTQAPGYSSVSSVSSTSDIMDSSAPTAGPGASSSNAEKEKRLVEGSRPSSSIIINLGVGSSQSEISSSDFPTTRSHNRKSESENLSYSKSSHISSEISSSCTASTENNENTEISGVSTTASFTSTEKDKHAQDGAMGGPSVPKTATEESKASINSFSKKERERDDTKDHTSKKDSEDVTNSSHAREKETKEKESTSQVTFKDKPQRVTRSSHRIAASVICSGAGNTYSSSASSIPHSPLSNSPKASSSSPNHCAEEQPSGSGSSNQKGEEKMDTSDLSGLEVHPRKRKIRQKEQSGCSSSVSNSSNQSSEAQDDKAVSSATVPVNPEAAQNNSQVVPMLNCYEMYQNIRRQIERRRRNMVPVQPKPPQGFKDYLMNRATYVLGGNPNAKMAVPILSPPPNLPPLMKDLYMEQEKERHKLRLQHLVEKEKLVLSVEQEILRVHGRAARALSNQSAPFSVCTVLKDEEIYNLLTPEQEEKDKNARSRYNGRLFLSWLQDVDDKWDKIKETMLLRHHNEAQSLHAVQKMDWGWKLKEVGLCEPRGTPIIDKSMVPIVHVSDDFDLLPA